MTTMYLIQGSTGEYSDRSEWNVCAYESEELAKQHLLACQDWYLRNIDQKKPGRSWDERFEHKNPFDPFMDVDYTGTRWWICQLNVLEKVPDEILPFRAKEDQ